MNIEENTRNQIEERKREASAYVRTFDLDGLLRTSLPRIIDEWEADIAADLLQHEQTVRTDDPNSEVYNPFTRWTTLNRRSISTFLREFEPSGRYNCIDADFVRKAAVKGKSLLTPVCRALYDADEQLAFYAADDALRSFVYQRLTRRLHQIWPDYERAVITELRSRFDPKRVLEILTRNKCYQSMAVSHQKKTQHEEMLRSLILNRIPDRFVDLYPTARQLRRRFILHIGPTNSGKTWQALEALKQAERGIYLGPLRLLAYEQFERLNEAGVPCNLITGEEKKVVPDARVQASTVEIADLETFYDVAVIDEAQMLNDESRGGAWVAALMGLCAGEIHVCAAPYAEEILLRIIRECQDEVEVVHHERMTELTVEKDEFLFPEDVQKGDVLVVFSKRNVHAVASELQAKKRRCSVIYGSLPYDVRHNEAHRFSSGETDVVVATDAIGMGMNLPIRRVIFLEDSKFDGVERRLLKAEEVTQIAGRAGRFGIYDHGYVNAPVEIRDHIVEMMSWNIYPIRTAVIRFPETLTDIDARLSELMERWMQLEDRPGFVKQDMSAQLKLLRMIESETEDKHLLYRLIMIPFDEEDIELQEIWKEMALCVIHNTYFDGWRFIPELKDEYHVSELAYLEHLYEICDLIYYYMNAFTEGPDTDDELHELLLVKNEISRQIMTILESSRLQPKKCKRCGRVLAWNYPYGLCVYCHNSGDGGRGGHRGGGHRGGSRRGSGRSRGVWLGGAALPETGTPKTVSSGPKQSPIGSKGRSDQAGKSPAGGRKKRHRKRT